MNAPVTTPLVSAEQITKELTQLGEDVTAERVEALQSVLDAPALAEARSVALAYAADSSNADAVQNETIFRAVAHVRAQIDAIPGDHAYELVLTGFNGMTDATDDLILWVGSSLSRQQTLSLLHHAKLYPGVIARVNDLPSHLARDCELGDGLADLAKELTSRIERASEHNEAQIEHGAHTFWVAIAQAFPEMTSGDSDIAGEDLRAISLWLRGTVDGYPALTLGLQPRVPEWITDERVTGAVDAGVAAVSGFMADRGHDVPAVTTPVRAELDTLVRHLLSVNMPAVAPEPGSTAVRPTSDTDEAREATENAGRQAESPVARQLQQATSVAASHAAIQDYKHTKFRLDAQLPSSAVPHPAAQLRLSTFAVDTRDHVTQRVMPTYQCEPDGRFYVVKAQGGENALHAALAARKAGFNTVTEHQAQLAVLGDSASSLDL